MTTPLNKTQFPPVASHPLRPASILRLFALLLFASTTWAQVAPSLGTEAPYGIVSSTYSNTALGTSIINGRFCASAAPAVVPAVPGPGGQDIPCAPGTGLDQLAALANLNGQLCTVLPAGPLEAVVIGANPAGTIPPGCYFRAGAIDITAGGIVRLNGNGVYIFRSTGGAVTTGANSQVLLQGGACADNVFWAPVAATSLGANSSFVGNILDAAGVVIGDTVTLLGRALAFGGTVSTVRDTITVPAACVAPPPPTPTPTPTPPVPTMGEWAKIILFLALGLAGFLGLRRQTGGRRA